MPDDLGTPDEMMIYDPEKLSAREAALAGARTAGCTCDPDIEFGPAPHIIIKHDDWCALLRRRDVN